MEQTTVVLGVEDPGLQEALLRRLESVPGFRVVAVASEPEAVAGAVRRTSPDAAVVSTEVLAADLDLRGTQVLVVGKRETTAALQKALRAGARGFYLWPEERDALVEGISRSRAAGRPPSPNARVVAVFGPRGGVGTTFLATHLAAAVAGAGRVVLADLDLHFAGVTTALGLSTNGDARTILDVEFGSPGQGELGTVLRPHPRGFSVLQAPSHQPVEGGMDPEAVRGLILALRDPSDLVVLHLPRSLDPFCLAAMDASDVVLMVVTLDVMAFRDTARALGALEGRDLVSRCRLVINRARRAEVVPEDAERVFGLRPVVTIPFDPAVPRAQDRGDLLVGGRSRAARRVMELARSLLEEPS